MRGTPLRPFVRVGRFGVHWFAADGSLICSSKLLTPARYCTYCTELPGMFHIEATFSIVRLDKSTGSQSAAPHLVEVLPPSAYSSRQHFAFLF